MATKATPVTLLSAVYSESISHEKAKRGLGNRFHQGVIALLNEYPSADSETLVKLFGETVTEVENTLVAELTEAFGEDATPKDLGAWTQYKSNYKRALEMVDRSDLMKCKGPYDVNMKLQEVRKALKEKESGAHPTDESPADNGAGATGAGGKAGDILAGVPASARPFLEEALKKLSDLSDEDAAEVAEHFKNATFARIRAAKKKLSGVTGSADKAAAN